MDIKIKLLYIGLDLILPLLLGYACRQKKWLNEDCCNKMILVNILLFSTVLSVLSFWVLPLKLDLIWLPLFGILLSVIPGIAAYLIIGRKYQSGLEKGSYLASAMLSNVGTLGGLCAFIMFDEPGFAYSQIVALFQNMVLFLYCFPMAQYYRQTSLADQNKRQKISFASLFFNRNQLPVLGLISGMFLYVGGVQRPAFFSEIFTPLIHISAWMALIPVGYSIEFAEMKHYYTNILDLLPIKFIITPLFAYLIACMLFNDHIILNSILLLASTPTGINAVVTARLYNLNLPLAGAAFLLTTVIFLIIIYPLLCFWFALAH
ncbi:MAG: transporter [Pelosinus sp.]|nr:transporter [Pelosinus sp.]